MDENAKSAVVQLVKDKFHKSTIVLRELSSYEDTNVLIESTKQTSDLTCPQSKYVLKILCSSNKVAEMFPRKIECVNCLRSKDFSCSDFLTGFDGNYLQTFNDIGPFKDRSALFYSFLEGKELENTGYVNYPTVTSELGSFLAHFHRCLKSVPSKQDLVPDLEDPWSLHNYKLLLDDSYMEVIQEPSKKLILSETMEYVVKTLSASENYLTKDILHGDFHGLNIIVKESYNPAVRLQHSLFKNYIVKQKSVPKDCKQSVLSALDSSNAAFESLISLVDNVQKNDIGIQNYFKDLLQTYGIIDFEAVSYSYTILELGRLIADVMVTYIVQCSNQVRDSTSVESVSKHINMDCGGFAVTDINADTSELSKDYLLKLGGYVMAGYLLVNNLSLVDLKCVYPAVLISLCQYYILGTASALDPSLSEDYVSYCSCEAVVLLEFFHQMDAGKVFSQWINVADQMLRNV